MSGRATGRVILVGAGPGAPDLITLRGAAALRAADAVVYDALASPELLELAPEGALRIDVGKRGHDLPTRPQPEICKLIVDLARQGKQVVRLKGGDPFVFGRGGEEASACAEAGVPFEVVPGVSSVEGALAYAGIPLTDRRHAASFAVVTGHKDPTRVTAETRWELLAQAADTLVIAMGMRNLEQLLKRVLDAGRSPDTPAAVVMSGSLPEQRTLVAPLGDLARRVREAELAAPALVVIGDVVRLRDSLAWFEARPLFGMHVLVTRSEEQADALMAALREAGARPELVPMLRLLPPEDWSEVDAALDRIGAYDALLLTSANAVRFLAQRAEERGMPLAELGLRALAVGPSTAERARAAGIAVLAVPELRRDAEGLAAEISRRMPPAGRRFLLPRSAAAREALPALLREAGAAVDAVTAYRNLPPDIDPEPLRQRLVRGELDALTFTSPSSARHFAALLDAPARAAARRCWIAAIGPITAEALRGEGLDPDAVAEPAGAAELVAALAARVASGGAR